MNRPLDNQSGAWRRVAITAALALLAAVWPLPEWGNSLRPEFVAMVVIYWVVVAPFRIGMVFAWSLGLLLDILQGAVLGQHALALTVLAYLCFLFHRRLAMLSPFGQALSVVLLILVYRLIGYWVHNATGGSHYSLQLLLPAATTALAWPAIKGVLDRSRF